jgi:hypothetical protein
MVDHGGIFMSNEHTERSIELLREAELKFLRFSIWLDWVPGLGRFFRDRAAAMRDAHRLWSCIERLRDGSGAQVMLLCDNDDFNDLPNNAVVVCAEWTKWEDCRFTGDTLLDALESAIEECNRTTQTKG